MVTVDTIKSPITTQDEFLLFSEAISQIAGVRPQDIGLILKDLNENDKKKLKELLQTKRINVIGGAAAENTTVESAPKEARLIMKAKRRTVPRQ